MKYYLSKSKYCQGIQCPKMLWLRENKPEVFDSSVINEAVMSTGSAVGDFAMGLFGEYIEVPYDTPGNMIIKTKELIDAKVPVIAEASFSYDGLFCSVDILKNLGNNTVEIYEVKSSTEVKDIYRQDASFQYYILSSLGYNVKSCSIVHINNQYVRHGEIDINELFSINDITAEAVVLQPDIIANIDNIREYMARENEPADDIGEHCFSPYVCGFFGYCTKHLPRPNIFYVAGARTSTKLKCYRNSIISFDELDAAKALSSSQKKQIEHELHNYPPYIDEKNIRSFIGGLSYPLYFLDFESFQPAIPLFDNSRPYEQIVFQYSLHYIEHEGGELKHKEFLAYPGNDPRRALAEQLCADIPMNVCTTAYNMGFEKGRIKSLAELYPDLHDHLINIHDNIQDLMIPFQKKWYYCRAMQGSYSIKHVLPALFPDDPQLDYHNLDGVHNGGEASETFANMFQIEHNELEIARKQLLKYCELDTFAMVKVWKKLKEI